VLGTLVAFIFVGIGAWRLKLVNPIVAIICALGCSILACKLEPLVWLVYSISMPVGLIIYFCYGYRHSKLARQSAAAAVTEVASNR
jgi:APA family basic amino acid/polyamine antiporter